MKYRWGLYVVAGVVFGLGDWYYLNAIANIDWGRLGEYGLMIPVYLLLNYGVWIIAVVPAAAFEIRKSRNISLAAFSGSIVWASAVTSYYLYYTILLAFFGLPYMEHLLVINREDPVFWSEWSIAFEKIVLAQFYDWIVIALLGGGVLGYLVARIDTILYKR